MASHNRMVHLTRQATFRLTCMATNGSSETMNVKQAHQHSLLSLENIPCEKQQREQEVGEASLIHLKERAAYTRLLFYIS